MLGKHSAERHTNPQMPPPSFSKQESVPQPVYQQQKLELRGRGERKGRDKYSKTVYLGELGGRPGLRIIGLVGSNKGFQIAKRTALASAE